MVSNDNANPVIHSSAGPSRRSKSRFDALDLSDDDEWERRGRSLDSETNPYDEGVEEEIDGEEIFDLVRSISDPEHPLTLEQLAVVSAAQITVTNGSRPHVLVEFTPTVPHCSMATLIGLSLRVRLLRSLPERFKVDIKVKQGTHSSEEAVNKQLNDKERVAVSFLCVFCAAQVPTPAYLRLYEEWGKGAIGLIIVGNVPCDARYPEAKGNAIIDRDHKDNWDQVAAFKPVFAAAKAHGSVVIVQVTHAGRQTQNTIADVPVSSSDVQTPPMGGMVFNKPRPMTIAEIEDLVDRFAYTSKVLYDAGADGMQLHAAHGYLLSQFLSPRVNLRTDRYGGSFENRSRLLFEIVAAIRARVPDPKFILSIKINSADFSEGGFSAEESQETVIRLEAAGLDVIELSGGTYESGGFEHKKESTIKREAYFVEFAERIRPHLKTAKLMVTGGFRSAPAMAKAIQDGATDICGLGRPLTAEPDLSALLLAGKQQKAKDNRVPNALQTGSSVVQIADIAHKRPIHDIEQQEVADKVVADLMSGGIPPAYPAKL
ncbi:hypothetical protein P7C70_g1802, partial [Phenoliferia sp. Uapishka_3]